MPLDILGAIAVDAAGESMQKSSDKKKLEAAKDDPEEYERVLKKIEKRNERQKKGTKIVWILCFVVVFAAHAFNLTGQ